MVLDKLRNFLLDKFPLARRHGLGDETMLLETGILDSLGVLEIVTYIEAEYQITLSDEDLVPDNFQTLSRLALFLDGKIAMRETEE